MRPCNGMGTSKSLCPCQADVQLREELRLGMPCKITLEVPEYDGDL